ncbi:hypothetical protein RI054_07g39490 [Pseudoscourfieldia marina]
MSLGSSVHDAYARLADALNQSDEAQAIARKLRIPPPFLPAIVMGTSLVVIVVLVLDFYASVLAGFLCWIYPTLATMRLLLKHIDYEKEKKKTNDSGVHSPPPPGTEEMLHWLRYWTIYATFVCAYDPLIGRWLRATIPLYQLARTVLFFSLAIKQTHLLKKLMDFGLPIKRELFRDALVIILGIPKKKAQHLSPLREFNPTTSSSTTTTNLMDDAEVVRRGGGSPPPEEKKEEKMSDAAANLVANVLDDVLRAAASAGTDNNDEEKKD